jgi:hypothetical protein
MPNLFYEALTSDDSGARAGVKDRFLPVSGRWTFDQAADIRAAWETWDDNQRAYILPVLAPHFAPGMFPKTIADWLDSKEMAARQLLEVIEHVKRTHGR